MKCRLLADELGPDPDDPLAQVVRPEGTVIEDRHAWILCCPNGEVIKTVDSRTGVVSFESAGRILAEPVDEECAARVAQQFKRLGKRNPHVSKQSGTPGNQGTEVRPVPTVDPASPAAKPD